MRHCEEVLFATFPDGSRISCDDQHASNPLIPEGRNSGGHTVLNRSDQALCVGSTHRQFLNHMIVDYTIPIAYVDTIRNKGLRDYWVSRPGPLSGIF